MFSQTYLNPHPPKKTMVYGGCLNNLNIMGLVWLVDPLILGSEAWAHLRCMQWVHHQVHPAASERHNFPLSNKD